MESTLRSTTLPRKLPLAATQSQARPIGAGAILSCTGGGSSSAFAFVGCSFSSSATAVLAASTKSPLSRRPQKHDASIFHSQARQMGAASILNGTGGASTSAVAFAGGGVLELLDRILGGVDNLSTADEAAKARLEHPAQDIEEQPFSRITGGGDASQLHEPQQQQSHKPPQRSQQREPEPLLRARGAQKDSHDD
eukprot:CAMPEP_0177575828 /NCGR_PEP_ID=MMETSP0369-20130122/79815_1 /TAXON_ID=447022 ORGANISM="Scrippsiella hangoei-like, Strain SHHI-4" /NCGR_SAMPLE_ID=MMETSP0369 /ASSEMBLY_ACC=CAM_ASM_000364 /LENGTH=194 /DNA_ID=CAMNT_0019064125 /DNA_START=272 /DNA_END=855 /DNA_ORIENTATION=-